MRGGGLPPDEFERVVEEALAGVPERFARMLANVVITIEEEPTPDDIGELDDPDDDEDHEESEILGIYRGVALTERSFGEEPMVPDEIAIFRGPINRVARDRAEAVHEVRETVIHEIGHYFGLDEDELP